MGKVIDIEEAMPHFCIFGPDKSVHIVPVNNIVLIAQGKVPLLTSGEEDEDTKMIRGIIINWLDVVGVEHGVEIGELKDG